MYNEMQKELGLKDGDNGTSRAKNLAAKRKASGVKAEAVELPGADKICPECGEPLVFEGGCNVCKNCGWSKCY